MSRRVYLDHNASTPVHPEVLAEMLPFFSETFGNPSSVHGFGREARDGLDTARERVARFLGVGPEEIVFTSGGTESDNLGVKGLAWARGRGHLITSKIEHHAVLRACQCAGGAGLHGDLSRRGRSRHGRSRRRQAGAPTRHDRGVDHARQQRGGDDPAGGGHRRHHSRGRRALPRRRRADVRQDRPRSGQHRRCCRSPVTRSTGPRASRGCGSARAPRWSPCSTAASTSVGAGLAPRTSPASSASARRWRSGPATCGRSGAGSRRCATGCGRASGPGSRRRA